MTVHFEFKRDQGAVEKVQSDMTYKGYENRLLVIEVCLTCWYRQFWIKAVPNTPQHVYFIWGSRVRVCFFIIHVLKQVSQYGIASRKRGEKDYNL